MHASPCAREAIRSIREQLQVQTKRVHVQQYSESERLIRTLADELRQCTNIMKASNQEFENLMPRFDPFSSEYERLEQLIPMVSAYIVRAERTLAGLPGKFLRESET